MPNFESALSIALALACLALLARILQAGLIAKFRFSFSFFALLVLELSLLMLLPRKSDGYTWVYLVGQSVNLLVACGVVREIYSLALNDRPALAAFGEKVVLFAFGFAVVIAATSLILDPKVLPGQFPYLHWLFTSERAGNLVLVLLLLMIGFYVTWFPVRLQRNIQLYAVGFTVFFLARSSGLLAINLSSPTYTLRISNTMMVAETACIALWVFGLRRERDDLASVGRRRWNPVEMDRLSGQLDSINTALTRFNHR